MTPDEHRADLATQHEDAAVEARGDIRMDLAQAGEWIW